jgi:hypothetical protein
VSLRLLLHLPHLHLLLLLLLLLHKILVVDMGMILLLEQLWVLLKVIAGVNVCRKALLLLLLLLQQLPYFSLPLFLQTGLTLRVFFLSFS